MQSPWQLQAADLSQVACLLTGRSHHMCIMFDCTCTHAFPKWHDISRQIVSVHCLCITTVLFIGHEHNMCTILQLLLCNVLWTDGAHDNGAYAMVQIR